MERERVDGKRKSRWKSIAVKDLKNIIVSEFIRTHIIYQFKIPDCRTLIFESHKP